MQLLLDRRHRHDPFMRVSQVPARVFRLNRLCFKQKNARDNLEAVVDAVIHLFEKKILLPQQLVLLALQGASLGDIFDRQQQARAAVAVVEYLSSIQQHCAPTDRREVALDLIRLNWGVVRDDVLEELAQCRNVPLTAA